MTQKKVRKVIRIPDSEAEVLPPSQGDATPAQKMKEEIVTRDEMGQRKQIYKKYREGVDYTKIGTEEYQEIIGTIKVFRDARGHFKSAPKFNSGAELEGAIDAYWDWLLDCAKNGNTIVPDTEGLASYLGVDRGTLINWRNGGTNREFAPVVERAMNDIAAAKKQMGIHGKIPQVVMAMDFNNNHGYVQQNSKMEIEVSAKREPMREDQLIEMANLLPRVGKKEDGQ